MINEKTLSMLDKTISKTVHKDDGDWKKTKLNIILIVLLLRRFFPKIRDWPHPPTTAGGKYWWRNLFVTSSRFNLLYLAVHCNQKTPILVFSRWQNQSEKARKRSTLVTVTNRVHLSAWSRFLIFLYVQCKLYKKEKRGKEQVWS